MRAKGLFRVFGRRVLARLMWSFLFFLLAISRYGVFSRVGKRIRSEKEQHARLAPRAREQHQQQRAAVAATRFESLTYKFAFSTLPLSTRIAPEMAPSFPLPSPSPLLRLSSPPLLSPPLPSPRLPFSSLSIFSTRATFHVTAVHRA